METPVILSAVRTPVGKFQGGLASFSAPELGGKVVAEAARRAGLGAKQIDEAILGNVVQAGLGQNPARQAALKSGCDPRVAALTINKVCGSGLKAVGLAAQAVTLGESEIVAAGGNDFAFTERDCLRCKPNRFQTGTANFIYSQGGDARIASALEGRLARGILSEARLHYVAQNRFVDLFCAQARAACRFGDHFAAEFGRGEARQAALEFAHRRANGGENYGSFHASASK